MSRIKRLQKKFEKLYIDAFLVTDEKNIYYLTGFNLMEGDGCLLVTKDNAIIITDDRYQLALEEFENDEVVGMITRDYYGSFPDGHQQFNWLLFCQNGKGGQCG